MKILFFIFLFLPVITSAKTYGYATVSKVVSVYDGDSFFVNVNWWPAIVGDRIGIRINGIDTPELRGKCQKEKILARKAKQFLVRYLRSANVIELRNVSRGKYFRIVSDVYIDDLNIGKIMIESGYAIEYHGGTKKKDWCI